MTNPVKSGIQPMDKTHSTTASAALAKMEEDLESQKSLEIGNSGIGSRKKEYFIPSYARCTQHRQIKRVLCKSGIKEANKAAQVYIRAYKKQIMEEIERRIIEQTFPQDKICPRIPLFYMKHT